MLACTSATSSPATAGQARPIQIEPVRSTPTAAANAPASIIPSSEMLIVPAFSATSSPEAANSSTTAAMIALR